MLIYTLFSIFLVVLSYMYISLIYNFIETKKEMDFSTSYFGILHLGIHVLHDGADLSLSRLSSHLRIHGANHLLVDWRILLHLRLE